MKCPYCGEEMIEGYIKPTGRAWGVIFTTEFQRSMLESFKSHPDDVILTQNAVMPFRDAYHCPKCHKVIVDYLEDKRTILE